MTTRARDQRAADRDPSVGGVVQRRGEGLHTTRKRRILVTDGDERSTLAVTRSLGRAGFEVEVCAHTPKSLAGASRFSRTGHRTPNALRDPSGFVLRLREIVRASAIDVLIPMSDVSATVVLSSEELLEEVAVPMPPPAVWLEASDKRLLMDRAAGLGVPVPRQTVAETPDFDRARVAEAAAEVGYPLVLKPHRSAVVHDDRVERFGVRFAQDEQELVQGLAGMAPGAFPVMLQQRIQGPGLGGFFIAREGELTAAFAHRRLREMPPYAGVSVLRESVPLRKDLLEHSRALLRSYGWSGVAMVEFKEDARTGTPYLMEINGRFWGSLQLAIDAGLDFPRLLVEQAGARPADSPAPAAPAELPAYPSGVRSRWLWGDVDHLIWMLRKPRRVRALHPGLPGRTKAVLRFLAAFTPSTRSEVLRLRDPGPFVHETLRWFGIRARS